MMACMPSQHAHKARGFRPDPEDFAAAEGNLKQRGRTVGAYLKACLKWCAEDPDAAIAAVDSRWPEIKPPGWPHVAPPDVAPPAPAGPGKNPGSEEDRSHPGTTSRTGRS
jgi:hypothetical protein